MSENSDFKMPGLPLGPVKEDSKKNETIKEGNEIKESEKSSEIGEKLAKMSENSDFKMPGLPMAPVSEEKTPKVDKKPEEVSKKSPAEMLNERSAPPLQYSEPPWSGIPSEKYFVEELKNGTIVKEHSLSGKSYFVIGRLPSADIQMEHPSLSRFHAILQFKEQGSPDQPVGFYLYDLGSTHGTFHNKNRCFAKTYYRLRVGHGIKVGGSTRLLILQGPQEDMEEESELSLTELKEKALKAKLEKINKDKNDEDEKDFEVNWGMAEDATEDETPDMSKNPFAQKVDEDLNLDDPKRTLRGWFEREGYELEYNCTEKGYANFTCTVDLPINEIMGVSGAPTQAEFSVKGGKKKEAVVQCALEACRILNRFGLLRQSNHESRAKKQVKKWKDNDYYDSDEDEYLDRTGSIENKRQKRMKIEAKDETQNVETYDTLKVKHEKLKEEISGTEKEIKDAVEALSATKKLQQVDDLDDYMNSLQKTEKAQGGKENVSKLRQKLQSQQNELKRLEKMVNIAKPTEMPKLVTSKSASVMIGKRWGFGKSLRKIEPVKTVINPPKVETVKPKETSENPMKSLEESQKVEEKSVKVQEKSENIQEKSEKITEKHDEEKMEVEETKPQKKVSIPVKKKPKLAPKKDFDDEAKLPGDYDVSDPKYATWVPPENQTGDGRTSLNDKFGY